MLLSKRQLVDALSLPDLEIVRLLRRASEQSLQHHFDAFMEKLTHAFQEKREAFEKAWATGGVPQPAPKPSARRSPPQTTALAVRSDRPTSLMDPKDSMAELEHKMGYDVFQHITALARASGLSRSTLVRMRDGHRVRRASLEKIRALGRLSTRTVIRRMRPPELE